MKNIKTRLKGGLIALGLALLVPASIIFISGHDKSAVPVTLNFSAEKPIIVLDAGHGECS